MQCKIEAQIRHRRRATVPERIGIDLTYEGIATSMGEVPKTLRETNKWDF